MDVIVADAARIYSLSEVWMYQEIMSTYDHVCYGASKYIDTCCKDKVCYVP